MRYGGKDLKSMSQINQGDEKDTQINEIVKNTLFIIQDTAVIKSKLGNSGNLIKLVLKNSQSHYEIAVGNNVIRINQYKA